MNKKCSKFIALICTHNGEKFIRQQIDSIYSGNENFEILVYDFDSNDRTRIICEEYSLYRNLKVHCYNFAPGPKDSFMFALSEFKKIYHNNHQDYLLFLSDQDDIWKNNKFFEISNLHNDHEYTLPQFVHHNVQLIDESCNELATSFYDYPESIINSKYSTLYFSVVIGHTVSMNKSFVELLTSFDGENLIMHDWWLSIIADLNNCRYYSNQKLSYYRIHSNNTYGLNSSGFDIRKKIENFISNCIAISNQRKKMQKDFNHKDDFFRLFKLLLSNFRFKLLILILGQKIFSTNE